MRNTKNTKQHKTNCAVIMAGGKGIRLRPLTYDCPKPMIKVAGRPILERIIHQLKSAGISEIYVSLNYLGEVIEKYFQDGKKFGVNIKYVKEKKFLHTGGSLSLIRENFSEPIIIINGDLVTDINFKHFLNFHKKGKYVATMGVKAFVQEVPFGVIKKNRNTLIKLIEKPKTDYLVNAGIYILNPEVIKLIPKNKVYPITNLFEKLLLKKQKVGVYNMKEDWIDVGRLDELKKAEEKILCSQNLKKY